MQTSSQTQHSRLGTIWAWARSPRGRTIIQVTLIALVLVFFVYELIASWGQLSQLNLHLNYGYLGLSLLPLIGRPFLSAFGWWQIVRKLSGRLSFARSIHIYFISGLARYLPGPFLGSIGRAVMAEENGVEAGIAAISVVLELGLLVSSGALVGLVWVAFRIGLTNITFYLILLGASSLILLDPRVFLTMLNFLLVKLRRKRINLDLHLGDMLQLFAPYLLNWLLNGLTFYLVVNAIFPAPSQLFNLSGIYIAALTIAIFGLTFPDGWGIREFTLINMLTALAGIPAAIAGGLALFSRVWWMAAEALWVGLALFLRDGQKAKAASLPALPVEDKLFSPGRTHEGYKPFLLQMVQKMRNVCLSRRFLVSSEPEAKQSDKDGKRAMFMVLCSHSSFTPYNFTTKWFIIRAGGTEQWMKEENCLVTVTRLHHQPA